MSDLRDLRADCSQCSGLCCVALPFGRSRDFAVTKPAGEPCRNLAPDFRCSIHPTLRASGWPGCTVFDCFGAGQLVTQHSFEGRTWRTDAELAPQIFSTFEVMRRVQEVRYYLETLRGAALPAELRKDLDVMTTRVEALAMRTSPHAASPEEVHALHAEVSPLLRAASLEIRRAVGRDTRSTPARLRRRLRSGADLIGAELSGLDLTGADLRSALLVAADLRESVLDRVDLLGADLRDAQVAGADLSQALFLTQPQVAASRGDEATLIPAHLTRPTHWDQPA